MTQQFTASEVHERERFEEWYATHSFNYSRDPIGSRDCSLQWEAWKAALAAHSASADAEKRETMTPRELAKRIERGEKWKLADEPAPCQSRDAERLAEALHNLRDAQKHYMEHRTSASEIREPLGQLVAQRAAEADAVLATHSAQAQPPAASVTEEMVERARSAFVQADDGSTGITDAIRAALLAAQENPNG